jgi:hypothetical protein
MHSHRTEASGAPGRAQPRLIRSPPVAEDSDASAREDGGEDSSGSPPGPPSDAADGGSGFAPAQTTGARPDGAPRPAGAAPTEGRARRIWVRAILALATLLAVLAIFAIWADRQLLSPAHWANTSTQLLQKSTIRTALSSYLIDQLYANVDVSGEIKSGLPTRLAPLAGPISGALHTVAEEATKRALATPQVQNVWRRANHAADETLVTIVNGGGRRVQIQGGTVSLNLREIVADLARRLGWCATWQKRFTRWPWRSPSSPCCSTCWPCSWLARGAGAR